MKKILNQNKRGKSHTIYAIYDESSDKLAAVSLDYNMLETHLQLGEFEVGRFSIVEFDIRLV